MSLVVYACKMLVASKACSSACSALLLCTVFLSTFPKRLSSPFWLVGSVALGGVNGGGGTGGNRYRLHLGKQTRATAKLSSPTIAYPNIQQVK